MRAALLLLPLLLACGDKEEEDDTGSSGTATDGGIADGGTADGGTADGGTADGGTADGGTTSSDDIAALLVDSGGCSDAFIWAASADDMWALTYRDDSGIAERAHAAGTTLTESYDLSMDYGLAPTLSVQRGEHLRSAYCNDVTEPFTVDQEWWGSSGIVTISVTPTGEPEPWGEFPASATLTLDGATFTAHGTDPVRVSTLAFTVAIGWLPG